MIRKICECAAVEYGSTDRLMVLFSSKPAMRRDVFDYVSFVQNMPHTKLFLRDAQSDYLYHAGIEGLTSTIEETVEFIQYFIRRTKPGEPELLEVDMRDLLKGKFVSSPPLESGDIVFVERRGMSKFNYYLRQLTPALNSIMVGASLKTLTQ